jgi:cholesterol transport system auxiliary component
MLSACSFFSPVKTHPVNHYLLSKTAEYIPIKRQRPIALLVSLPDISPVYNTTQMAYTIRPYEISYFAWNQWAEVPQEMFQPLLVKTLERTHHFKAIVTPPYAGGYDYVLDTEILELLQDYTHRIPLLVMTVRAQIINVSRNRVIGTRSFTVVQPILRCSPYAGVFAANDASAHIQQRIAEFCLERIR